MSGRTCNDGSRTLTDSPARAGEPAPGESPLGGSSNGSGLDARVEKGRALLIVRRLLGLLLIAVVLINVANATSRYLFSWSPTGADEAMVYLMIVVVMTGSLVALIQRQHISVNLIPGLLKGRMKEKLHFLHDLVGLFASACAAWWSWSFVQRISMLDIKSMALGIPMTWPHAVLFIGLCCFAMVCAGKLLRSIVLSVSRRSGQARAHSGGESR